MNLNLFFKYFLVFMAFALTSSRLNANSDLLQCYYTVVERETILHKMIDEDKVNWIDFSCTEKSFGYIDKKLLIKLVLPRSTNHAEPIIAGEHPVIDYLTMRTETASGDVSLVRTGSKLPIGTKEFVDHKFIFSVKDHDISLPVYLEIVSEHTIQVPIFYTDLREIMNKRSVEFTLGGLFFGIMVALALYNLFLFSTTQNIRFLHYSGYVLSHTVFQFSFTGFGYRFFWPDTPFYTDILTKLSIPLSLAFMTEFTRIFLATRSNSPKLDKLLITILIVHVANIPMSLAMPWVLWGKASMIIVILSSLSLFFVGLLRIKDGGYNAKVYLFAWSAFLVGIIVICLRNIGVLPFNYFTGYAIQIGAVVEVITLSFALGNEIKKSEIKALKETTKRIKAERERDRNSAIAQTTQMLAHDVRNPFSILQAVISLISDTKDTNETKEILVESIPAISKAMNDVNGMISDVMEVGSTSKISREKKEPTAIVYEALADVFGYNEEADIKIETRFDHSSKLEIDVIKVPRIFVNILANAVELMESKGTIWIETEQKDGMIRFCLGNSDTFISSDDINQLFEAFFTKNKKGGTGLGLAIAKKITEAHHGKIWCKSSRQKGTEFFFTLPVSCEPSENRNIPNHSSAYLKKIAVAEKGNEDWNFDKSKEQIELEKEISTYTSKLKTKLKIAVIDDEPIYIKSLDASVSSISLSQDILEIESFSQTETFINRIRRGDSFDLAIVDVDYGPGKISGFTATERLRDLGFRGTICIHSNRGSIDFQPRALKLGADIFLPKPMTKEHILSLVLSIIQSNRLREAH